MLRLVSVALLIPMALSCKGKDKSDSSGEPAPEQNPDPGTVDVDTDPEGDTETVIELKPDQPGVKPHDGPKVSIVGALALETALTGGDENDTVVAIPVIDGKFDVGIAIKAKLDAKGAFKLEMERGSSKKEELQGYLDGDKLKSGAREQLAKTKPDLGEMSDAEIIALIKSSIEKYKDSPYAGERAYVIVSMKASGDRVAEAASFRFIGLSTGAGPMILFPAKVAKGDMSLGKITPKGDSAVAALKADDKSFDLSAQTIANMASTSNALKTVKNVWMNADPKTGVEILPTPSFTWGTATSDSAEGHNDVAKFQYGGFSSYISLFKTKISLASACAADEDDRTILGIYPPVEVVDSLGDTYGPATPRTNAGALSEPLASEGGGERQRCMVGSAYVAGNDYLKGEVEQLGLIGTYEGAETPTGLWLLKKATTTLAYFDLAITDPRDADGVPRIFIPSLTWDVEESTGKITAYHVAFNVWNPATKKYERITDVEAFERIRTEIGFDAEANVDDDRIVGSTRSFSTVKDGVVTITELKNQGGDVIQMYAPGSTTEPSLDGFFLYYRAFGNSYNFKWTETGEPN